MFPNRVFWVAQLLRKTVTIITQYIIQKILMCIHSDMIQKLIVNHHIETISMSISDLFCDVHFHTDIKPKRMKDVRM